MPMYCFCFDVVPTASSRNAEDIAGGKAHVWSVSDTQANAEIKARSRVMDYAWQITAVEFAFETKPEQIARLEADEAELHRQALEFGVAMGLIVWPKQPRDEAYAELRPLGPPLGDDKPH